MSVINCFENIIKNSNGFLKLDINNLYDSGLIIAFGALGSKNKSYLLENQMNILFKNVLFFNSDKNDWFVEAKTFLNSESVEKSAVILQQIIEDVCKKYSFDKLIFIGHSMGAYGLLTYISLMEFSIEQHIIVSCPKIDLEVDSITRFYKVSSNNKFKNQRKITRRLNKLNDLNKKNFYFLYGEKDLLDTECVLEYRRKFLDFNQVAIKVVSFLDSGHYLLRSFKNIGFNMTINSLLNCDFDSIIGQGNLHNKLSLEDISTLSSIPKNEEAYFLFLNKMLKKYPEFFYALNRLGIQAIRSGQLRRGLQYLKRAHRISPSDVKTNTYLAQYYIKLQKPKLAILHYSINFLNSKHKNADVFYMKMLEAFYNLKRG